MPDEKKKVEIEVSVKTEEAKKGILSTIGTILTLKTVLKTVGVAAAVGFGIAFRKQIVDFFKKTSTKIRESFSLTMRHEMARAAKIASATFYREFTKRMFSLVIGTRRTMQRFFKLGIGGGLASFIEEVLRPTAQYMGQIIADGFREIAGRSITTSFTRARKLAEKELKAYQKYIKLYSKKIEYILEDKAIPGGLTSKLHASIRETQQASNVSQDYYDRLNAQLRETLLIFDRLSRAFPTLRIVTRLNEVKDAVKNIRKQITDLGDNFRDVKVAEKTFVKEKERLKVRGAGPRDSATFDRAKWDLIESSGWMRVEGPNELHEKEMERMEEEERKLRKKRFGASSYDDKTGEPNIWDFRKEKEEYDKNLDDLIRTHKAMDEQHEKRMKTDHDYAKQWAKQQKELKEIYKKAEQGDEEAIRKKQQYERDLARTHLDIQRAQPKLEKEIEEIENLEAKHIDQLESDPKFRDRYKKFTSDEKNKDFLKRVHSGVDRDAEDEYGRKIEDIVSEERPDIDDEYDKYRSKADLDIKEAKKAKKKLETIEKTKKATEDLGKTTKKTSSIFDKAKEKMSGAFNKAKESVKKTGDTIDKLKDKVKKSKDKFNSAGAAAAGSFKKEEEAEIRANKARDKAIKKAIRLRTEIEKSKKRIIDTHRQTARHVDALDEAQKKVYDTGDVKKYRESLNELASAHKARIKAVEEEQQLQQKTQQYEQLKAEGTGEEYKGASLKHKKRDLELDRERAKSKKKLADINKKLNLSNVDLRKNLKQQQTQAKKTAKATGILGKITEKFRKTVKKSKDTILEYDDWFDFIPGKLGKVARGFSNLSNVLRFLPVNFRNFTSAAKGTLSIFGLLTRGTFKLIKGVFRLREGFTHASDAANKKLRSMGALGKGLARLLFWTKRVTGAGVLLKAAFLTIAYAIGSKVVQVLAPLVKKSIDLSEATSKLNEVYAGLSGTVKSTMKELTKSYNISNAEATKYLGNLGHMAQAAGFAKKESLEFSAAMVKNAADIASFNNAPTAEVIEDIGKAMTGSREVLTKYGIVIHEADIKQQLLADGTDKLTGLELKRAKALATQTLVVKAMGAANGDVSRTIDSTANRLKTIKVLWDNFKVAIGNVILKAIDPAITAIRDLMLHFSEARGTLFSLKLLLSPIYLAFRAFMASVFAVAKAIAYANAVFEVFYDYAHSGLSKLWNAMDRGRDILDKFNKAFSNLKKAASQSKFATPITKVFKKVYKAIEPLIEIIKTLGGGFDNLELRVKLVMANITLFLLETHGTINQVLLGGLNKIAEKGAGIARAFKMNDVADALDSVAGGFENIGKSISDQKTIVENYRKELTAALNPKKKKEEGKEDPYASLGADDCDEESKDGSEDASQVGTPLQQTQEYMAAVGNLNKTIGELMEIENARDKALIEQNNRRLAEINKELSALEEKAKKGEVINYAELDRIKKLKKEKAKLDKDTERRQKEMARRQKAMGISSAIIATAQGITQVWASPSVLPSPADMIVKGINAGLVAASGLAQIAAISATPAYARGGIIPAGQSAVVGDSLDGRPNPEVIIPRSESLAIPQSVLDELHARIALENTGNNQTNNSVQNVYHNTFEIHGVENPEELVNVLQRDYGLVLDGR